MDAERENYPDPKRFLEEGPSQVTCLPMMWKVLTPEIREEI